jgi:hypothetical protein
MASVLVVVVSVRGMPVFVVQVVDVIAVGHRHVPTTWSVRVVMAVVGDVFGDFTLVVVVLMFPVHVAVVHVVDVILVRHRHVPTAHAVVVGVVDVSGVTAGVRDRPQFLDSFHEIL